MDKHKKDCYARGIKGETSFLSGRVQTLLYHPKQAGRKNFEHFEKKEENGNVKAA